MKALKRLGTAESSRARVDVLDVGPEADQPFPEQLRGARRWRWSYLAASVALVVAGIALVPATEQTSPATDTSLLALPKPVAATSTIPPEPIGVSVISDETFSLIPVSDLRGFDRIAGPVLFEGRHWVAGSGSVNDQVVIFSSADGANWTTEGMLTSSEPVLQAEELIVFGDKLVAFTTSAHHGAPFWGAAQTLSVWESTDGRAWSRRSVEEDDNVSYFQIMAASGDGHLLVTSFVSEAYDDLLLPLLPAELLAAIEVGDLSYTWERDADSLFVIVYAPPGVVVFVGETPVTQPPLSSYSRIWQSDDVRDWTNVDHQLGGGSGLAWVPDFGFVRRGDFGTILTSSDGLVWERNSALPPADYMPWGTGLLGVADYPLRHIELLSIDNGETVRTRLATDMFSDFDQPAISAGTSHLIAVTTRYQATGRIRVASGDLTLTTDYSYLRIMEGENEKARLDLFSHTPVARYVPDERMIAIEASDGGEPLLIPVGDLLAFWAPFGESPRIVLYQSSDGLVWSKSQISVLADSVIVLGETDAGFLVGLESYAPGGWLEDITVYRTGPVD